MSEAPRSVLLLQLKRIGDAILTAPATAALRSAFPGASQTMVLSGAAGALAETFPLVDEVLCYQPGKLNVRIWKQLITRPFDLCLDFSGTDRSALMARCSGAPVRVGYRKFSSKPWRSKAFTRLSEASVRELHTIDFHRALVQEVAGSGGIETGEQTGFAAKDPGTVPADFDLPTEPFAVVHPGSARPEKYWPAGRWAEVIFHLSERHGLPCVVTGAGDPAEMGHLDEIRRNCPVGYLDLSGRLSLVDLAGVIGRSTIALGVDSAAMHLAAMQACRQVVLFGPTNPFHWRPRHRTCVSPARRQ